MPRWPSLIAVVERAESEVVVELGVPLVKNQHYLGMVSLEILTASPLVYRDSKEALAYRSKLESPS